jgi:hypothetical protein
MVEQEHMEVVIEKSFDMSNPEAMKAFIKQLAVIMAEFAISHEIGLDETIDRVSITHPNGKTMTLREIIERDYDALGDYIF